MSKVSIAATTPTTFVYEGRYRPRGELSFAERAAWGLCSQALPKPRAAMRTRAPSVVPTLLGSHAHVQLRPAYGTTPARRRIVVAHDRLRRVWKAQGNARSFSRHALEVRWRQRAVLSRTHRWRRYTVKVLGRALTLVMANGKSFISACPQGGVL